MSCICCDCVAVHPMCAAALLSAKGGMKELSHKMNSSVLNLTGSTIIIRGLPNRVFDSNHTDDASRELHVL